MKDVSTSKLTERLKMKVNQTQDKENDVTILIYGKPEKVAALLTELQAGRLTEEIGDALNDRIQTAACRTPQA